MSTSSRTLKILAALVWYIGAFVLILKAVSLLLEANAMKPQESWTWLTIIAGVMLGGFKTKFLFNRSCQKNIDRIDALDQPKAWQFFRPRFFFMLMAAVTLGATLSRLAHGNYPFLLSVALLDLSIGIALLGSSLVFWKHKGFVNK